MRDFSEEAYAALLDAGLEEGYEFLTVREYLASDSLPERLVILRHDVDRKPRNALTLGRIEAVRDVPATYYVRTRDRVFDPDVVTTLDDLGHEIGYHYEDLDRADGHVPTALDSFAENLARVRRLTDVDTVCMHGNPLTSHDNRDMWADPPEFDRFDLLGEAYLSMSFDDVTYFSDTGRTWEDGLLKVKDHTMGEGDKSVQAETTPDLIRLLRRGEVDRLCVLAHPDRWSSSTAEHLSQGAKDAAVNAVKYGIQVVR